MRQQGVNLPQERNRRLIVVLPQLLLGLKQQALHPAHLQTQHRRHSGELTSRVGLQLIFPRTISEIFTSLRLSLSMGTLRTSPRQPRASVHSSSTNTDTSSDKRAAFSFSSRRSCRLNKAHVNQSHDVKQFTAGIKTFWDLSLNQFEVAP